MFEIIVETLDWVKIESAFRNGRYKRNGFKQRDIIIKLTDWASKNLRMSNFKKSGNHAVESLDVQVFPVLAPIMLQKRRDFKFLTD